MQTEVQLFGYDLFDPTYVLVNEEWPNLLGGEVGCKSPPVVKLKKTIESTPTGLLILPIRERAIGQPSAPAHDFRVNMNATTYNIAQPMKKMRQNACTDWSTR